MQQTVLATFSDRNDAEDAISILENKGYNPKDMSIVMKDTTIRKEIADDTGAQAASDTVGGAVTGAAVGGIAGLVSVYALPSLGAFFIGGPIAVALGLTGAAAVAASAAVTGALAGGFIGGLMGLGLSQDEARVYEERINEGGILVAVPIVDRQDAREAREVFNETNADNVKIVSQSQATTHRHAQQA
jgi:hypothetical protein